MTEHNRQDDKKQRWFEALDACRHNHPEDVADFPGLSEQLEGESSCAMRQQLIQLDARIEAALHEVAVPENLAHRLLNALSQPTPALVQGGTSRIVCDPDERPREDRLYGSPVDKFRPRWAVAAMATAAALFVLAWFTWPSSQYTSDKLLSASQQYYLEDVDVGQGQLLVDVEAPRAFVLSSTVVAPPATTRWRNIEGFLGRRGVAYDLIGPRGVTATLYVMPLKGAPQSPEIVGDLPSAPRSQPASSGGLPAEAWTENGRLYVLVVNGSAQDYRQFLRGAGSLT